MCSKGNDAVGQGVVDLHDQVDVALTVLGIYLESLQQFF